MGDSKKRKFFEVDENDEDAVKASNYDKDPGSFLRFYRSLPAKTYDTVRIFERPDFYTVYDEDAELIAKEFFNTTKVIKQWGKPNATAVPRKAIKTNSLASPSSNTNASSGSDGPQYLHINKGNQFETILKVLIHEKRSKVEIYACGDDRKWVIKKRGSPGNLAELEDVLYGGNNEMQETNTLIAVKLAYEGGQRVIGAAFVDVILKKIGVAQLLDNEQMTNLESLIMQVGAKECYTWPLDEKELDCQKMKTVYEKCDLVVTEMKRSDFASQDVEQDLRRLLGEKRFNTIKMSLIDDKHAMSAVSCLLNGLALMGDESNFGAFKMYRFDLNQYMRLDTAAIYALNVLPNPKEPNQGQNLYGLLNRCKTPMGSRKLLQWLKQPLLDLDAINNRHDIVQIFYEDENLCKELRTKCLRRIPDLERLSKKVQKNRASLQDCVVIYQFIQRLPEISDTLKNSLGDQKLINEKFIEPLERLKKDLAGFENLVEETIDLEMVDEGEYVINPSFDDELKEISDKKKKVVKKIKGRDDEVKIQIGSPSSFKIDNDKTHGWFYRISRKDEKCIGGKKNEKIFTILQPISKVLKFQDAEMKALSEKYTELSGNYSKKSADLVREIMKIVSSYLPVFEEAHELIAEMDVYTSFADVAYSAPYSYVRPDMKELGTGNIVLKKARHPVLEIQPDMTFIPNDTDLVRGESSFQIITGPNMGGKSTFIRQVGVVVLMAQIGSFVPCDSAEISICDAILARVGAGDSQLRGVSTFMAEMLETSTILHTATQNSLIIIDELGRGTSTYDGFGLAWAISEFISTKINALCLFATHFHELTQLEEEVPHVKNYHVEAQADDEKGLILLYEVKPGPTDQSFGIHVAKIANFPKQVIELAEQKATELENFEGNDKMDVETAEQQRKDDQIMETYLKEFTSAPLDTYTAAQVKEFMKNLKAKVDNAMTPSLKAIIQRT